QLKNLLKFYDPISIDAFLYHYDGSPHLVAFAKQVITEVILEADDPNRFTRNPGSYKGEATNWYRYFWEALVSGKTASELVDPNFDLNFNVITFNYDASFEHFLHSRV